MTKDLEQFNDELRFKARSDSSYWNSVAQEELERINKSSDSFEKWLKESRGTGK